MKPPPPKKKKKQNVVEEVEERASGHSTWESEEKSDEEEDTEISDMRSSIRKFLHHSTFEPKVRYWLDTGSRDMNAALGSPKYGLPYGKIYELSGIEHSGKTAIATVLAGLAQVDGAAVGYIDLEDSRDPVWAAKLGLNWDKVYPIYPRLTLPRKKKKKKGDNSSAEEKKAKSKIPQLQSAEQLFEEAETAMEFFREAGYKKQIWIIDSVANIQTEMAVEAGLDYNMRVNLDRAAFLSKRLPKWAGLASNYNAIILMLNQIRIKPGVSFGNPEYSPGGRALGHACAIRAKVRRVKGGGTIRFAGKVVGICAKVENFKNKAGKGSLQDQHAAFKIKWKTDPAKISFMSVSEAEDV